MKVKKDEFRYKVEGAKYVFIRDYYISNTLKHYELCVRKFGGDCGYDRIKLYSRLSELKDFLAKYDNEKDLLADYYMARLEGKFTL